ncbi:hypothetical protein Tco_0779191 [Tanacetum coccineum]
MLAIPHHFPSISMAVIASKEAQKQFDHNSHDLSSESSDLSIKGLPPDVYTLVNHHTVAKEIWDIVKLLIEGTELSLQERESKLYNEFDRFKFEKGETIHSYYLRCAQLINDMNTIEMTMKKLQVNTKFVKNHKPEWSKFVTNVKLAKDMHESSFDHLYAYVRQYEVHANEVHMTRDRFLDPLSLVANIHNSPSFYNNHQPRYNPPPYYPQSLVIPQQQQFYTSLPQTQTYEAPVHQQSYTAPVVLQALVIHQQSYQATAVHQQSLDVFPQLDPDLATQSYEGNNARSNATRAGVNRNIGNSFANQSKINDLDTFDSNYDEAPSGSAILMAKLSAYDLDVLSELQNYNTYRYNNVIDQNFELGLYREVYEVKAIFQQMETEVEQLTVDRKYFDIEKKELLIKNERLLEQIISQDIVCIARHSYDGLVKYKEIEQSFIDEYSRCVQLEAELSKKKDIVEKAIYNELSNRCSRLEKRYISLEIKVQQSKESFQHEKPCTNQDAPEFLALF